MHSDNYKCYDGIKLGLWRNVTVRGGRAFFDRVVRGSLHAAWSPFVFTDPLSTLPHKVCPWRLVSIWSLWFCKSKDLCSVRGRQRCVMKALANASRAITVQTCSVGSEAAHMAPSPWGASQPSGSSMWGYACRIKCPPEGVHTGGGYWQSHKIICPVNASQSRFPLVLVFAHSAYEQSDSDSSDGSTNKDPPHSASCDECPC